jgi:ATP-dependent DNA ligase
MHTPYWEPGVLGLRGLLVAAPWDGRLRHVANVRTGFTDQDRRCLSAVLASRSRTRPVVRCPHRGLWVEPDLLCQVNYLEWTRAGRLRGASFQGLCCEHKGEKTSKMEIIALVNIR